MMINKQTNKKMPASYDKPDRTNPTSRSKSVLPGSAIGWWALGVSVIGLVSWVLLPVITIIFREVYPITDTRVMPAIGLVLIDGTAIMNVLAIWRWRERSVLNIAAAILVILLALFFTFFIVGESLSGV